MLLTENYAEEQMPKKPFAFKDEDSSRYVFTKIGEMSAHHYITPGSHLYVHYSSARKK